MIWLYLILTYFSISPRFSFIYSLLSAESDVRVPQISFSFLWFSQFSKPKTALKTQHQKRTRDEEVKKKKIWKFEIQQRTWWHRISIASTHRFQQETQEWKKSLLSFKRGILYISLKHKTQARATRKSSSECSMRWRREFSDFFLLHSSPFLILSNIIFNGSKLNAIWCIIKISAHFLTHSSKENYHNLNLFFSFKNQKSKSIECLEVFFPF